MVGHVVRGEDKRRREGRLDDEDIKRHSIRTPDTK